MSSHKYSDNTDKGSTHYLASYQTWPTNLQNLPSGFLGIYVCQLAKGKPVGKDEQLFNTHAFKYPAYHWEDP